MATTLTYTKVYDLSYYSWGDIQEIPVKWGDTDEEVIWEEVQNQAPIDKNDYTKTHS